MRTVACLTLLLLALPLSAADAKFDPDERARALAALIEEETFALVRIDLTRTELDSVSKSLRPLLASRKERVELFDKLKAFQAGFIKAGGTELVVSFSTEEIPGISFVSIPLKANADVPALTELLKPYLPDVSIFRKRGSSLVAGPRQAIERLAKAKPSARSELPAAVKAAGNTSIQVLLLPTADQRRVIEEALLVPVPGTSAKVLTRGVLWAALGLGQKVNLTLQSADTAAAKKLADLIAAGVGLVGGMNFLGEEKPLKEFRAKDFETAAHTLKAKVSANQVTLQLGTSDLRSLASLANTIEERSGGRRGSIPDRNFGRIGRAMHRYLQAHGTFPPHAIYSKAGKPLLSWRVAILPYLGEDKLYKEFRLDEAWDSEHNKKLIDRLPKVYRDPGVKDRRAGLTTYLAPINKEFVFTGTQRGVAFKELTDGTANTAVVVDVNDELGAIWSKPSDLVVDKKDPWKGLLGHYPGFVVVGLADGSGGLRVAKTVSPETVWALFTRAGGEVLTDLKR